MKRKIDFDILESLRGMASLYVCIGHSRAILWIGGEHFLKLHPVNTLSLQDYLILGLNMLTRLSSEFVIIFFVLSGFSIAHSLRNSKSPLPFYKRRFIRLYPPYITAILWAMLITWLLLTVFPDFFNGTYKTPVFERLGASTLLFDWKNFAYGLFYLPQLDGLLGPFWSLTQEVIFYLLAPFLFRNTKAYYILSAIAFFAINVLTLSNLVPHSTPADFLYYNFFFAAGAGLYYNYETVLQKVGFAVTKKALWLCVALFFIMVAVSLTPFYPVNPIFAAVMSTILILYLVTNNTRIPWLIGIGRFSYTLYITHYPSIFLFMGFFYYLTPANPPYIFNNLVFIPCVLFCLLIAYGHYNLIEKRTKYLLDRLRKRDEERPSVAVPYPLTLQTIDQKAGKELK